MDPLCIEQQDSTDSFIDSPLDMTPNSLSSLLSASVFIPDDDEEREKNKTIKEEILKKEKPKQDKDKDEDEDKKKKCQLSADCNEFIPGLTTNVKFIPFTKRQLSVIDEDDEEEEEQDQFDNDKDDDFNLNCFEVQES